MKISVVTVCKDNLKGLIETYQSIAGQDTRRIEWIVIDGASTDGSVQWLSDLTFSPLTWLSEEDSGIYNAMNKGIARIQGDYAVFMNSGDCFACNAVVGRVITAIETAKVFPRLVYGPSLDISPDGKEYFRPAKSVGSYKLGMFTHHQAMFFRSDLLRDLRYDERFQLSGDYHLVSRVVQGRNENEFLRLDFPVCRFLLGGLHVDRRIVGLREDEGIRRDVMKMGAVKRKTLFMLHWAHHYFKMFAFGAYSVWRYKSPPPQ